MKKRLITAFTISLAAVFIFTGCYDALFTKIREEVALEDADVSGIINSVVRFKNPGDSEEYLFLQNGNIKYKKAAVSVHGAWTTDNKAPASVKYDYWNMEFSGTHFSKVAADKDHVYALGVEYKQNSSEGKNEPSAIKLYSCSSVGGDWSAVEAINTEIAAYFGDLKTYDSTSVDLICTNAPNPEHRTAYLRIGNNSSGSNTYKYKIYRLNGTGTGTAAGDLIANGADSTVTPANGEKGCGKDSVAAVWFGGSVHFFNYISAVTNETAAKDPTYVYYGDGKILYSFLVSAYNSSAAAFDAYWANPSSTKPAALNNPNIDCGSNIISIAVTSDALLIGTDGSGTVKVSLDSNGLPAGKSTSLSIEGASVMSSPYIIPVLLAVNPELPERETSAYSAMNFKYTEASSGASLSNRGLWSYYQSRGNWNRE